jgi:hypothetical protein
MSQLAKYQLIGPVILFAAVLAAEIATYALTQAPSSAVLWYINLKVFGLFQRSYYLLDSYTGIPHFELFFIALPTFVLGCIGLITRHRLLVAISSNLSFVYAGFLSYSWTLVQPTALQTSLTAIAIPMTPDFYLAAVLVGSSLLSFCISHFIYIRSASAVH